VIDSMRVRGIRHSGLLTVGLVLLIVAIAAVLVTTVTRAPGDPPATVAGEAGEQLRPAPPARPGAQTPTPLNKSGAVSTAQPSLPDTDDPDAYAVAIAEVLYGMDHSSHLPADYEALFAAALWEEIVPEAREAIEATISARIPDEDMWQRMGSVAQTGSFELEDVWEPGLGRQGRGEQWWPPGVVMRTASGTQTETWRPPGEQTQTSTRPVAVTVVVVCAPSASPCRLVGVQPTVEW
jgi:hypothetical protein